MRAFSEIVDGRNGFSRVIHGIWVKSRKEDEGGDGGRAHIRTRDSRGVCETTTDEKVLAIRIK